MIGHVEDMNEKIVQGKPKLIEVRLEAEERWRTLCDKAADGSLLKTSNSWIFGTNVPGRKPCVTFHFYRLKGWLQNAKQEAESGYPLYLDL